MTDKGICPCNSNKPYSTCCEPLLAGDKNAITAENLMRSRYTAYVQRDVKYLLKTWHPSTRPANIDPATISEWYGLHIVNTEEGGEIDDEGVVEFKATSLSQKKIWRRHEISRFVKEDGQWFYIDGEIQEMLWAIVDYERSKASTGIRKHSKSNL
jgi:SEC-C motif-containing protein